MAVVPSLLGALFVKNPQSIIAYTINMFFTTPQNIVPLFKNEIISLRELISLYSEEPDNLTAQISSSLQKTLDRIFEAERNITVSTTYNAQPNGKYDFTIVVTFNVDSGELRQLGAAFGLVDGQIVTPEYTIPEQ